MNVARASFRQHHYTLHLVHDFIMRHDSASFDIGQAALNAVNDPQLVCDIACDRVRRQGGSIPIRFSGKPIKLVFNVSGEVDCHRH